MFLIADTTATNPPYYLVSGELAVRVYDTVSIAALQGVGIPLVQGSPEEILSLTIQLTG